MLITCSIINAFSALFEETFRTFAVSKDKGLNFIRESLNLAPLLYRCHDNQAQCFFISTNFSYIYLALMSALLDLSKADWLEYKNIDFQRIQILIPNKLQAFNYQWTSPPL